MTEDLAVAAVDAARAALLEQVGEAFIGDFGGSTVEDEGVVTYFFASTQPGYPGWRWAVTLAQPVGQDHLTIDEVALLPSGESIIAPAWVPWRERIRPGDLSPGDLLPTDEDDPRLVPPYLTGDPGDWTPATSEANDEFFEEDRTELKAIAVELGLGRSRVLSIEGRDLAAQRWYDGEQGSGAVLLLWVPGPARWSVGPDLRCLCERVRQRRRPCGRVQTRLWGAFGGSAAQEAASAAAPGPRLRHGQPRRSRGFLIREH
jgi:hypothetical protein